MATSIYDSFLPISSCNYYCKQLADKLNLNTFSYYYDKKSCLQIPSTEDVSTWKFDVPQWQRTFQLNKPKTIQKMGLENYVLENHELSFHLTVRGYSIVYVVKFSDKLGEKPVVTVCETHTSDEANMNIKEPVYQQLSLFDLYDM